MIIKCPCGQKNRLPSDATLAEARQKLKQPAIVCGKCKRQFTEQELMIATMAGIFGPTGVDGIEWADPVTGKIKGRVKF